MGEFMWNELNRILGVNRKDGLSEPEGVRDAAAPEPGHEPDTAGGAAAAQSQRERERHEPARMALPKNSAPATDDGLGVSPVDDAEWARIIAEESSFDADPVESAAFEWDPAESDGGDLPRPGDRPVTESEEPRPFGFALPSAGRRKPVGRRLVKLEPGADKSPAHKPEQRLLILDCWQRSGLPAKDFADLVGVSKHTLYAWKKAFTQHGPAGLMDRQRGAKPGSRLPEVTQRSILMLKQAHPDWGCERISAMLARGPALGASPGAVSRVLHEAGYELEEAPTRPHPDKVRSFERAMPNQLWQTDLFTFVLKRQNRRECLEAAVFIDLADARARIGHFIDWYNFRRPHKGIDHLAPADRFFGAAPEVLRTLRTQVAANALELARNGVPRPPFYVTGQVGGKNFSLHAEGERVFLTQEGQQRREVDLAPPAQATTDNAMPPPLCPDGSPSGEESGTSGGDEPAPGTSPLDDFLPAVGEHRPPDEPGDDAGEPQNGGVS